MAVVLTVVCLLVAGHCATLAVRPGPTAVRAADANHVLMALAMVAMAVPALSGWTVGLLPAVALGLLALGWAAAGAVEWVGPRAARSPSPCGAHPLHLVAANAAMAVMVVGPASGTPGTGSGAAAPVPAVMPMPVPVPVPMATGHAHGVAAGSGGSGGLLLVTGLALGLYFLVHAVWTAGAVITDRSGARRWSQLAMSAAMAAMLLGA